MNVFELVEEYREAYVDFLKANNGALWQSLAWGEFQRQVPGRGPFWVLGVEDKNEWLGTVMVLKMALPFGRSWLYVARGPVMAEGVDVEKAWTALFERIRALAREQRAVFVRVELPSGSSVALDGGWREAHAHYQPEWSLVVDLSVPEEEILKQMKPKGRYNIKMARKKGVAVRETHAPSDVSAFYSVLKKTGGRDGFHIHPESYYQNMVMCAQKEKWGSLFVAELEGMVIGGLIMTEFGETATYYYGASDHDHRFAMAPYLAQWVAMRAAKNRGATAYDFLGIAPPKEPNHPWAGITQFKKKFGGREVEYPKAREYAFSPFWYWILRLKKVFRLTKT